MIYFELFFAIACLISTPAWAATQSSESEAKPAHENPLFGYTHLLPSPLTLPAGRLALGTDVAYGVFDQFEIGTGLLQDIYQVYNAMGKVSLYDSDVFAIGAYLDFMYYNLHSLDSTNPDLTITAWKPGLVAGFAVDTDVAAFVGANLDLTSQTLVTNGIVKSGYVQGAEGEYDMSWAYSPPAKKKGVGSVLAAGMSYDFTYKLFGIGLSHYWHSFKVGFHYYPNADKNKILPIIAGGAVVDF